MASVQEEEELRRLRQQQQQEFESEMEARLGGRSLRLTPSQAEAALVHSIARFDSRSGLRHVERTVERTLLPSADDIRREKEWQQQQQQTPSSCDEQRASLQTQ